MNETQNQVQNVLSTQKATTNTSKHVKSGISAMSAVSPINRVSHVSALTGVSPLLNLVTQDFSSYDSNKSYFHEPKLSNSQVDPTQINNNGQSAITFEEGEMNTTIISASTSNLPHASSQIQEYFNQDNRKSQKGSRLRQKYELKLSIQYKTQIGEYLAVVGNIDELGKWTDFEKCKLKWTEGHFWVADNLVILNKPYFLYKYVIMELGEPKIWEQGPNRLADLDVLQDKNPLIGRVSSQASMSGKGPRERSSSPTHKQNKFCEINDEWEYFKIKFSINDPIEEQITNQGDYMRIIGSTPKLGSNNAAEMESTEPIRMNRTQRPIEWLIDKYGQKIRPWEITISFKNTELLLPNEIIYNYSKSNSNGTQIVKEREPSRSMIIQPPETYNGELGDQNSVYWKNQQKVWIVNGTIEKCDANFLGGLFFDKVGDTNVFIGTYPLREDDIQKMKEAGITGIMNLQTDQDIFQRAVPIKKQKELYKQKNIKFVRFPLNDNDEDDFCANLFTGAQYLNNMINIEGLTVYVHCTSGISRAPALLVVYLCLFKRVKQWQSPYHVSQFVKAFHVNTNPNMRAVQRVVEANLAFQNLQTPVSPERSFASIKQKSTDRSVTQNHEIEGFYFPQMIDDDKKNKNSSQSPNRSMLPPRPSRKSAYVKQFVPIHHKNSQMNQYINQKQISVQKNSGTRSITPTPSAQSKIMQTQQISNQNQTINVYHKSENQSQNEKDLKNIMKYHENSPLSISEESKQKSFNEKSNQFVLQQLNESSLQNEQNPHQETPIISPRQKFENHDKLVEELDRKKKQLVDNNVLLEAAMKAALVVPNQVQINHDHAANTKSSKDYAKEHLMQEMDARAKRAENLRLKRQMAANSKKNKSDEKKDLEEIQKKGEKIENDSISININSMPTESVQIIQTQQIIQKNIVQQTHNLQKVKNNNETALKSEYDSYLRLNNQEQIKLKQEEQTRKESIMKQINVFSDLYIQELINNKSIPIINEVYENEIKNGHQRQLEVERIAREEAEKEVERFRKEIFERDILERQRQQQLEDEQAQKERLRRISEENELEKARLKQMMDEQEIEKMRKKLHEEHLKMLWEAQRRQETLKDIQDAEEQELERRALKRIARDKEERIRRIKQEEDEIQQKRLDQFAKDKVLQQQMIEAAELEAEQLRQQRIKNAQEELERLQNLRKEEEEKLQKIKESFEEEEKQRKIFLERERLAEKIRRDHEEQIRLIKLQQQQLQLQGQQFLYSGFQQRGLQSQEFISQIDQIKTSLVNVYYESNMNEIAESQIRSPQRNKSFEGDSKVSEQNCLNSNHIKSKSIIQQDSQNKSTQNIDKQQNSNSGAAGSNELDQKTVTDFSDIDKKSILISQQALKQSFEDQRKVKANIRDESIDKKCEEFFGKEAPIKFIVRKGNKLEDSIQKLIKKFKMNLPIIHLRQQMYLFGTQKINIEQKVLQVMIRYGNNIDRFDAYSTKNQKKMERQLIQYMSMSQETLPQVIDKLIKGEKIVKAQIITPERNVTPENKSPLTPRANQSKYKPIDNFVKRVQLKLKPNVFGAGQNSYRSDSQTNNNYVNGITQMREKSGLSSRGSENSLNQSNHHFLNNSIQESIKKTRLNRFQNPVNDSFQSLKLDNQLNQSPERITSTSYDKAKILGHFQRDLQTPEKQFGDINVVNRISSPDKLQQMSSSPQKLDQKWSPPKFGVTFDQKQFQHDVKTKEAKDYFSKYQKQKTIPVQIQSPRSYRSGLSSSKQSATKKLQVIQKNGTYIAQIQINNNYQQKKYQK